MANDTLADGLQSLGLEVIRVNTARQEISSQQGNTFSWRKAIGFLVNYWGLTRAARSDIIYITPGQTFFGVLKYAPFICLSRLLRIPFVLHIHGNHLGTEYSTLKGWRRAIFRSLLRKASAGIVLSNSLRRNFDGILTPDRVHVVENFADSAIFESPPTRKATDFLRILFLSNLMPEKGPLVLLKALREIHAMNIQFEAVFSGQLEESIRIEFESQMANISDSVAFVGPSYGADKIRLLREANTFVLPTFYAMEGQPISILEALAAGNIIVSTAHAGIPDIISSNNGFLVPANDVAALTNCLASLASNISESVARIGGYNREYAAARFTEDGFVSKILGIFEQISLKVGS